MEKPDEYTLIFYDVRKVQDKKDTYKIEGNQRTIKIFLELMERYIAENRWVMEPDDSTLVTKS